MHFVRDRRRLGPREGSDGTRTAIVERVGPVGPAPHVEERRVLQGRLTLVRYNNEPQFFMADASVFLGLVADIMERLGPYLEPDAVETETLGRLRDAIQLIERKTASRS